MGLSVDLIFLIGKLRFLSGLFAKALNFFARKSYGIITKDFEAKVYGLKYCFWSKFVWHYNEGFWGYFVLIKVWKKRGLINFCLDQSICHIRPFTRLPPRGIGEILQPIVTAPLRTSLRQPIVTAPLRTIIVVLPCPVDGRGGRVDHFIQRRQRINRNLLLHAVFESLL